MASTSPTFNAGAAAPSAHVFRHLRPDHPDRRRDRRPDPGQDRSRDRGQDRGLERVSARWAASAAAARGSMGTSAPGKDLPVGTLVPVLIADTYWCYGDTLYFPAKKLLIALPEVCVLVM